MIFDFFRYSQVQPQCTLEDSRRCCSNVAVKILERTFDQMAVAFALVLWQLYDLVNHDSVKNLAKSRLYTTARALRTL